MVETTELKAEVRERSGKGAARAVRRQGRTPAVIYGEKQPPIAISLPTKEATRRIHAGGFLTRILTIDVGGEAVRVIPKDYQLDPVKDTLLHIDFLRIGAGSTLVVEIPVHFINEDKSPGLRRGGVLNVVRHAVELEVPADAIPESLTADLDGLDINDAVHISDVTLPAGVRPTITDRDFTIATIAAPAGLREETEAEETEGGDETAG